MCCAKNGLRVMGCERSSEEDENDREKWDTWEDSQGKSEQGGLRGQRDSA